ncbi:MAG: tryptophan 7-halogenase [Gemmatimonadetes bacterium]|nr:tryptophan 7-halogenase [Gemmatimonadota bacterium]
MTLATPADVLVVGGGPAAAAAARLLASWGHAVVVATGRPAGSPPLAESLPPSTRKLFGLLGLMDEVERGGFVTTTGNTSWWGDAGCRALPFGGGTSGFQVERGRLDRLLLDAAGDAGAGLLRGATVRHVDLRGGDVPVLARVRDADGRSRTVRARRILDCSGRAGVLARDGLRERTEGFATIALVGVWARGDGWPLEDPSHTLVESYDEGWTWSVPVSPTRRYVAAMVDPASAVLRRGGGLDLLYRRELARTHHLRRLLEGATAVAGPWAYGATPYGARRFGGDAFLLVGDAGSFLDPLSSYGVKKALASGWLAAVATHTALTRPAMAGAALELFEEREREVWRRYRTLTAGFYRDAGAAHGGPFWSARADAAGPGAGGGSMPAGDRPARLHPDPAALVGEPAVREAFQRLRASGDVRLRPAATLRRLRRPTVRGREVVLEERLASPALPAGLGVVRGVDLPLVARLARDRGDVPGLFEAYRRAGNPVDLPDFLGALSVLLAAGMLENAAVPAGAAP